MATESSTSWKWAYRICLTILFLGSLSLFVKVKFLDYVQKPSSSVLSQVKQQSFALGMYAQDWDGRLPSANRWMDASQKYFQRSVSSDRVKNEEFVDLTIEDRRDNEFGYAFFSPLSNLKLGQIKDPITTPMAFQSKDLAWNANGTLELLPYRHEKKRGNTVSFVDGHAKFMGDDWRFETIVIDLSQPEELKDE